MNTEKLFNKFFVNYLIDDDKYDLMPMKDFEFYVKDRIKSGFIENVSDLIKDFYFAINKGLFSWSDKYVIWKNPTSPISFTTLEDFESKFERINRKSLRKYVEHTVGASFDELEDFESKMGSRNEENDIDESTNINQAKKLLRENGFYVFKKAKKLNEAVPFGEELDLNDVQSFLGHSIDDVETFLYDKGCECRTSDRVRNNQMDEIWITEDEKYYIRVMYDNRGEKRITYADKFKV